MNDSSELRAQITRFLRLEPAVSPPDLVLLDEEPADGFTRFTIRFAALDGDQIPAYLWIPHGDGPFPALLVHHQHAGRRDLGKSEVAGLAGDPWQAFGPQMARRGFVVLAPDSICFEDRRLSASGIATERRDDLQHFVEMGSRLVKGDTLMRKVLADASCAVALLAGHPHVDARRIGALGHSYGGNTTLFQSALDERISFAAASGALCSYAFKEAHNIPLEMALIIPGFSARWDLEHLLDCIAPRPVLVVSAADDPLSIDAAEVIGRAQSTANITHLHYSGGHALTADPFYQIADTLESWAQNPRETRGS